MVNLGDNDFVEKKRSSSTAVAVVVAVAMISTELMIIQVQYLQQNIINTRLNGPLFHFWRFIVVH